MSDFLTTTTPLTDLEAIFLILLMILVFGIFPPYFFYVMEWDTQRRRGKRISQCEKKDKKQTKK